MYTKAVFRCQGKRVLTNGTIREQWLIIKAEYLREILKVGVLNNKIPLGIVHFVVKICYCNFYPPVSFIVGLNMPMNSNRTHMFSTSDHRTVIIFSGT